MQLFRLVSHRLTPVTGPQTRYYSQLVETTVLKGQKKHVDHTVTVELHNCLMLRSAAAETDYLNKVLSTKQPPLKAASSHRLLM